MKHKIIKRISVATVFAGIGLLNFLVPYYGQQPVDEYRQEVTQHAQPQPEGQSSKGTKEGNLIEEGLMSSQDRQATDPMEQAPDAESVLEQNGPVDSLMQETGILLAQLEEETETIDQQWIEEMIKAYEKEIEPRDVADFRLIIGKLDLSYVTAVLEDPGGQAGEDLLKQYLRSKLTGAEYERSKELFFKYHYILLK